MVVCGHSGLAASAHVDAASSHHANPISHGEQTNAGLINSCQLSVVSSQFCFVLQPRNCLWHDQTGCGKTPSLAQSVTSAARAAIDFVALTARLKPRPSKQDKPEVFRKL